MQQSPKNPKLIQQNRKTQTFKVVLDAVLLKVESLLLGIIIGFL